MSRPTYYRSHGRRLSASQRFTAFVLLVVIAAMLFPLAVRAQTARDSAHASAQTTALPTVRSRLDSVNVALAKYVATKGSAGYVKTAAQQLQRALAGFPSLFAAESALIAVPAVPPQPVPTPTPVPVDTQPTPAPTPAPIPVPIDSTRAPGDAELPRVFLNTAVSNTPITGRMLRVAYDPQLGGSVQAAMDTASPGDRIVLPCGAHIVEETHWRKNGAAWSALQSDCVLPPEGVRMDSTTGKGLAWIESPTVNAALTADLSSGHLRVMGIRFSNSPALGTVNSTILLGDASTLQNTLAVVPTDIILDRIYIAVPDNQDDRRCISLQSARSAVIDSYVSNCKSSFDAQAITSTNSPGPLKIVNNFLESTGENISFGGGDPHIPGLVPSDIEIRHNWFYKRLSWKGTVWGDNEKNMLESKNSSHVLVDGNVFENTWHGGQYGWVLALYSVNQDGTCTWCVTEHWTFRNNVARNVLSFATITKNLQNFPTAIPPKAHHITVRNNLAVGVNPTFEQGVGRPFQIWDISSLTIEHNTVFGTDGGFTFDQASPTGVVIRNNLIAACFPVFSGIGQGTVALAYGAGSDAIFAGNVLFGCGSTPFTPVNPVPGNTYPIDWTGPLYAPGVSAYDPNQDPSLMVLLPTSPYKGQGTDGKDPGADVAAVMNAVAGVVRR